MKNVVILSFSGRNNGNCHHISEYIKQYYNNGSIYCVNDCFAPCNDCDYECLKPGVRCPGLNDAQRAVYEAVMHAEVVYYVIPNFCGLPASSYYAFNERSVGFFNGDREAMGRYMATKKRFVIVSNTENANFTAAMRQQTKEDPEVLYMKTGKYKKQSLAGDLLESEEARADLDGFLAADLS